MAEDPQLDNAEVIDGDTIKLGDGRTLRLRNLDAPELGGERPGYGQEAEPGSDASREFLESQLPRSEDLDLGALDATGERELAEFEVNGERYADLAARSGVTEPNRWSDEEQDLNARTSRTNRMMGNTNETDQQINEEIREDPQPLNVSSAVDRSFESEGTFERSLERGWANTKAMVGASAEYLGGKLGAETLQDWGRDYTTRKMAEAALNPAEVESYEDIEGLGELGTYVTETIGENIPNLATMAGGGGIGGLAAAGAGKALLKKAATSQAKKNLRDWGARGGAASATFPQHVGEGWMELREGNEDIEPSDTNAPLITGAINTALDVGPMEALARYSFGGANAAMAKDATKNMADVLNRKGVLGRAARVGKEAGKGASFQAPLEGVTEMTQELVNLTARSYNDPEFDWDSPEVEQQLREAFVAGGTMGGTLGGTARGASAAFGEARNWLENQAPEPMNPDAGEGEGAADFTVDSEGNAQASQEADQSTVVPEPAESTEAQVEAMTNPESSRDSVLFTPGEQIPMDLDANLPDGQKMRKVDVGEQGTLLTTNQQKFERVREAKNEGNLTEELWNDVLFDGSGASNKAQGDAAATARDVSGRVTANIMFDSQDPEAARRAQEGAQSQVPGGTVEVQSPQEAVAERQGPTFSPGAQSRRDRREGAGQNERAQPTGQVQQVDEESDAQLAEFLRGGADANAGVQSGETMTVDFNRRRPEDIGNTFSDQARRNLNKFLAVMRDSNLISPEAREEGFGPTPATGDADSTQAQVTLPSEQFRHPDANAGTLQALMRAAAAGGEAQRNRMTLRAPDGRGVQFNVPELVTAGAALQDRSVSQVPARERTDALASAVNFLTTELGFESPTGGFNVNDVVDSRTGMDVGQSIENRAQAPQQQSQREPYDTPVIERREAEGQSMSDMAQALSEEEEARLDQLSRREEELDLNDQAELDQLRERAQGQEERERLGQVPEHVETQVEMDSEARQNQQAQRESFAGIVDREGADPLAGDQGGVVNDDASEQLRNEADAVNNLLGQIGLRGNARMMDGTGVNALREQYKRGLQMVRKRRQSDQSSEERWAQIEENATRNLRMLEQLDADGPVARVLFLRDSSGQVKPHVFLADGVFKNNRQRHQALLHETGHVALRQIMSSMPAAQRQGIEEAFGANTDYTTFEENFANAFLSWASAKSQFARLEGTVDNEVRNTVRNAFQDLWNKLRTLWNRFRQKYTVDQTFGDFMEGVVNRERTRRGESPTQPQTEWGARFMEELEEQGFVGNGFIQPELFPTEYLDMTMTSGPTGPRQAYVNKARDVLNNGQAAGRSLGRFLEEVHHNYTRTVDNRIRKHGAHWFADHLRRKPRRGSSIDRGTVYDEERGQLAPFEKRIEDMLEKHMPRTAKWNRPWQYLPGLGDPQPSAEMQSAIDELTSPDVDQNNLSPLAQEVRSLFDDLYEWLGKQGVYVPYRQNYFPVAMSQDVLFRDGGLQEFKRRIHEWASDPEIQQWWQENFEEEATEQNVEGLANHLYEVYTRSMGQMDEQAHTSAALGEDPQNAEYSIVSPGFNHRRQRQLPQSLINKLSEPWTDGKGNPHGSGFRETDIGELLVGYTKAAVKRGVHQNRFGIDSDMGRQALGRTGEGDGVLQEIDAKYKWAREVGRQKRDHPDWQRLSQQAAQRHKDNPEIPNPYHDDVVFEEAKNEAAEFRDQMKEQFQRDYGVDIYDPAAGLQIKMREEVRAGRLSGKGHDDLTGMIPEIQGIQGADFNLMGKPRPWARRGQAAMLIYQNMRVLGLAIFAQMVDVGLIVSRTPRGAQVQPLGPDGNPDSNAEPVNARLELARTAMKFALNRQTREQLIDSARVIGAWQNDMTEHVMNDEAGAMMASRGIQRANEAFFKLNGMHYFTNFARTMSLSMGGRLIETWAREGAEGQLSELGISVEQARNWVDDGKPLEFQEEHAAVNGALNQFVDEGMLRPTPANRPYIGNDHRFALMWHLKSFMYTYHSQILERIGHETRQKWGESQGMKKMGAAMPALGLAAITLPLAALGTEMRWLISPPNNRPENGWDYAFHNIERSGMLGIAQILPDMHQAESYGRFGLVAALGPSVSQFYDFSTQGLSTLSEAYPLQNAVRGLASQGEDTP